jgi:hypothetical protein
LFALLFGSLGIFFPLGIYCLVLGRINRRPHPVLVAGPWDFAGVLFAVSGFLLLVGPRILTGFNRWPDLWLQIQFRSLKGLRDHAWLLWNLAWYLYFLTLLAGAAVLLWRRRLTTSVYNVEPAAFGEAFGRALDRLGLAWRRDGNRVFLDVPGPSAAPPAGRAVPRPVVVAGRALATFLASDRTASPTRPEAGPDTGSDAECQVELVRWQTLPTLRHMTVSWSAEGEPWRAEVEAELAKALREVRTRSNPVGSWLMWVSAGLFMGLFCLTVILQILIQRAAAL